MKKETIIISVGGSLIFPGDNIDEGFIQNLRDFVFEYTAKGYSFFLVCGGGKICRKYQQAASVFCDNNDDVDNLGIKSTHLNASLVRLALGDMCKEEIVTDYSSIPDFDEKLVIVGGGWKPGFSTDMDAVIAAEHFTAERVVNLSNITFVYDSDPQKNENAKPLERLSWKQYKEMIPKEWSYGMNAPFDPIASRRAERAGIEVAVINGEDVSQLENYVQEKPFRGTVIGSVKKS